MIKRTICLLIIFAMCLSFAACSISCNGTSSSNSVVSQVTSEGSDEGEQQGASSSVGTAQDGEGSLQSEGEGNSASGLGSNNADDNSGTDSDSGADSTDDDTDDDGDDNGDDNGTGTTGGTPTGTGSAQGGFAITAQPVSTSVAVGAPLTLSVTASGSGTLTYKWYTSLTNSYNGIEITGQTSSTIALNTANPFTQYYYCIVTQVSTGAVLTTNIATASAVGSAPTPAPTLPTLTHNVDVWVKGMQITPANYTDVLGDGTVSYNGATNTLTLNGATILYDGTADERSPIHSDLSNLTISINGISTVKSTGGSLNNLISGLSGIYSTGFIAINGSGTLNTTGGTAYNGGGAGISAEGGLTIFSGTINATGGNDDGGTSASGGAGIYNDNTPITIWGGTINATGGNSENNGGIGIHLNGGDLYIYGSPTVIAKGGQEKVSHRNGNGIYAFGITLGDTNNPFTGSLTAICGTGGVVNKSHALSENVTAHFFGAVMNYYTSTDGTNWSGPSDVSNPPLPQNQTIWDGVHFGTSAPSQSP